MYLAYNSAAIEKLGKPIVMMVNRVFANDARTGVSVRDVPGLRLVPDTLTDISFSPGSEIEKIIRPLVAEVIDDVVAALTKPLTAEEKSPVKKVEKTSRIVFKGNLQEVNTFFYKRGWIGGFPIIPPTEEAIAEMLTGTDLPPDHVVGKIPPRLGKATVEKIAVNAVMAGALPTYLPLIIAAVQAMLDPKIRIVGYSCSFANWAPLWIINGPIRKDLNIHDGRATMSPYYKPNVAIGHATGFITQNIGGIRQGMEDMANIGHEMRYGYALAENEEDSPWEPLHVQYGLKKEDNAITGFWPNSRSTVGIGRDAASILSGICRDIKTMGSDPGVGLLINPGAAKILADEGWTKKEIIANIFEYTRRPPDEGHIRWLKGSSHATKEQLPVDLTTSMRVFLRPDHIMIAVTGGTLDDFVVTSLGGGGDYGGPVTKKIELPKNWDKLVKKYKDIVPTYAHY
jgi:hypothetical protein